MRNPQKSGTGTKKLQTPGVITVSKYLVLLLASITFSGCTQFKILLAMQRDTQQFKPFQHSKHVKYEPGAEKLAALVDRVVPTAIETVRQKQGGFSRPITLYVTGSYDSFAAYCVFRKAAACVIADRLFVSPKLLQQQQRIAGIITHELSHLQFSQAITAHAYQTRLPTWFREGLAVFVANGAGAETVSRQQAIAAILEGHSLIPNKEGSLLFPHNAARFNLPVHMFYRQAALFTEWLHDHDPATFRTMLQQLGQHASLDTAMQSSFGFGVDQAWQDYRHTLRAAK